jgi:hypothetical protein
MRLQPERPVGREVARLLGGRGRVGGGYADGDGDDRLAWCPMRDREVLDRCSQPLADRHGVLERDSRQERHELLATFAEEVVLSHGQRERLRDEPEHLVAGGVAVPVVEVPETVDVDEQDSGGSLVRCVVHLAHPPAHGASVSEVGEFVGVGLVAQPPDDLVQLRQPSEQVLALIGEALRVLCVDDDMGRAVRLRLERRMVGSREQISQIVVGADGDDACRERDCGAEMPSHPLRESTEQVSEEDRPHRVQHDELVAAGTGDDRVGREGGAEQLGTPP